jgi:hypothetical protein
MYGGSALYLAIKLYVDRTIGLDSILNFLQELAQDIELIGPDTWKTWRATQVISENDNQTRLYKLNGHRSPLGHSVTKASSCYLRGREVSHRTEFTILSVEEEALRSMRALIENIYAPVKPASLDEFLKRNGALRVQAARIYDSTTGDQTTFTYGHRIDLNGLLAQGHSLDQEASNRLLSFSAIVDDTALPLKVRVVYVSKLAQEVGFSIESSSNEDYSLIDKLFTLADRAFRGAVVFHSGP